MKTGYPCRGLALFSCPARGPTSNSYCSSCAKNKLLKSRTRLTKLCKCTVGDLKGEEWSTKELSYFRSVIETKSERYNMIVFPDPETAQRVSEYENSRNPSANRIFTCDCVLEKIKSICPIMTTGEELWGDNIPLVLDKGMHKLLPAKIQIPFDVYDTPLSTSSQVSSSVEIDSLKEQLAEAKNQAAFFEKQIDAFKQMIAIAAPCVPKNSYIPDIIPQNPYLPADQTLPSNNTHLSNMYPFYVFPKAAHAHRADINTSSKVNSVPTSDNSTADSLPSLIADDVNEDSDNSCTDMEISPWGTPVKSELLIDEGYFNEENQQNSWTNEHSSDTKESAEECRTSRAEDHSQLNRANEFKSLIPEEQLPYENMMYGAFEDTFFGKSLSTQTSPSITTIKHEESSPKRRKRAYADVQLDEFDFFNNY